MDWRKGWCRLTGVTRAKLLIEFSYLTGESLGEEGRGVWETVHVWDVGVFTSDNEGDRKWLTSLSYFRYRFGAMYPSSMQIVGLYIAQT